MDDDARGRWNGRHRERLDHRARAGATAQPPAQWLTDNRALLPEPASGRRALDVACGLGSNAVWLARLGFAVDAIDISDVAVDALSAQAREHGLPIRALRMDLEREPLPPGVYDVIVQIDYLQRDLFAALADALAAGGVVVAETVTTAHVVELGNRFDPGFLLEPGELRAAFPGLRVVRHEERVVTRSGRRRAVARLVARRPTSEDPPGHRAPGR